MTAPASITAPASTAAAADRRMDSAEAAPEHERCRAFVEKIIVPRAGEFDRTGQIPGDVLELAARAGLWGAVIPAERGGTGGSMVAFGAAHEEIGRGCSSLRSLLTVHSMVVHVLDRWGSDTARRHLPDLIAGRRFAAFCLTEPSAGSDISALITTAAKAGDGYVINGHKVWTTGGQLADVLMVFARTTAGVSAFLVDARLPGIVRTPVHGMLGTRASMLAEFEFTDCRVDADCLVGGEGMGLAVATAALDIGRFSVACGAVGILQACLDASAGYAGSRDQGGCRIAEHQLVQQMLTSMATDLSAARLLCERAGRLKDNGDPDTITATCVAKYFASRAAMRGAADAVQIHGASGCTAEATVGRLFRDAKVMEIIEGSSQVLEVLIARQTCRAFASRTHLAETP